MALLRKKLKLLVLLAIAPVFIGAILLIALLWRVQHNPINIGPLLPYASSFIDGDVSAESLEIFWDRQEESIQIESPLIEFESIGFQASLNDMALVFDLSTSRNSSYLPSSLEAARVEIIQLEAKDPKLDETGAEDFDAKLQQAILETGNYLSKIPTAANSDIRIDAIHIEGVLPTAINGRAVEASVIKSKDSVKGSITGDMGINQDFVSFKLGMASSSQGSLNVEYSANGITTSIVNSLSKSTTDLSWLRLNADISLVAKIDLLEHRVDDLEFSTLIHELVLGQKESSDGIRFDEIPILIKCNNSLKNISIEPFVASSPSGDLALQQFEFSRQEAYFAAGSLSMNNLELNDFKEVFEETALPFHLLEDTEIPLKIKKLRSDFEVQLSNPPNVNFESAHVDSNLKFSSGEEEFDVRIQNTLSPDSDVIQHVVDMPWVNPAKVGGFVPAPLKAYLPSAEISAKFVTTMSREKMEVLKMDLMLKSKGGHYNLPLPDHAETLFVESFACHLTYDISKQRVVFRELSLDLPFCTAELKGGQALIDLNNVNEGYLPTEIQGNLIFKDLAYSKFVSEFPRFALTAESPLQPFFEDLQLTAGEITLFTKARVPLGTNHQIIVDTLDFEYSSQIEARHFKRFSLGGRGEFNTKEGGKLLTKLDLLGFSQGLIAAAPPQLKYTGNLGIISETVFDSRARPVLTEVELKASDLNLQVNPDGVIRKTLKDKISAEGTVSYDWPSRTVDSEFRFGSNYVDALAIETSLTFKPERYQVDLNLSGAFNMESLIEAYPAFDLPALEQEVSGRAEFKLNSNFEMRPDARLDFKSLPVALNVQMKDFNVLPISSLWRVNSNSSELSILAENGSAVIDWAGDLSFSDSETGSIHMNVNQANVQKEFDGPKGSARFTFNAELLQSSLKDPRLEGLIHQEGETSIFLQGSGEKLDDPSNLSLNLEEFKITNGADQYVGTADIDQGKQSYSVRMDSAIFSGIKAGIDLAITPSLVDVDLKFRELDVKKLEQIEKILTPLASKDPETEDQREESLAAERPSPIKLYDISLSIDSLHKGGESLATDLLFNININSELELRQIALKGTLPGQEQFSLVTGNNSNDKLRMNFNFNDLISTVETTSDLVTSVSDEFPANAAEIPFTGGKLTGIGELNSSIDDVDLLIKKIEIEDLRMKKPPFFLRWFSQKAKAEDKVQAGHTIRSIRMKDIHLNQSGLSIEAIDVVGKFTLTINNLVYSRQDNSIRGDGKFLDNWGIEFEGPLDDVQFYLKENTATKAFSTPMTDGDRLLF